jgi:hypothetical protein
MDMEEELHVMAIKWKIDIDKKSQKEADQAGNNMISLISDLAIIGKVAGEVLGKMWSGMQKSIKASIDQFADTTVGLTVGVDSSELNNLKYALGQIMPGGEKQAVPMVQEMDKLIQSFRHSSTGPEQMKHFFETMGRQGASKESQDSIRAAIMGENPVEVIKAFAALAGEFGDEFSNIMAEFNLPTLGALEIAAQNDDWNKAWEMSASNLFTVNETNLDALSDGWAKIHATMDTIDRQFGQLIGPGIEKLADGLMAATSRAISWAEEKFPPVSNAWKESWGATKKFFTDPSGENWMNMGSAQQGFYKSLWNLGKADEGMDITGKPMMTKEALTSMGYADGTSGASDSVAHIKSVLDEIRAEPGYTFNVQTMTVEANNPEELSESLGRSAQTYRNVTR